MLSFCIILSVVSFLFYLSKRHSADSKDIALLFFLFSIVLIWNVYFAIDTKAMMLYNQVIILAVQMILFYFISLFNVSSDNITIVAKQQNYWDVDKETVINAFKKNMIEKNDRIEVITEDERLYIVDEQDSEKKLVSLQTIKYFKKMEKNYKLVFIEKINDMKKYHIQYKIFKKLQGLIEKDKEIFLDYDKILNKFKNNLDFFLLYLWDKYSKDFNIGIGQLEALVADDIFLQEFINAIDNMNLSMIKQKGSYLQYIYYEYIENNNILED